MYARGLSFKVRNGIIVIVDISMGSVTPKIRVAQDCLYRCFSSIQGLDRDPF